MNNTIKKEYFLITIKGMNKKDIRIIKEYKSFKYAKIFLTKYLNKLYKINKLSYYDIYYTGIELIKDNKINMYNII